MNDFKQYDIFELKTDLNPNIKQGMQGVIMEVFDSSTYYVEFVKEDGTNYGYEDEYIFTIDKSFMIPIK